MSKEMQLDQRLDSWVRWTIQLRQETQTKTLWCKAYAEITDYYFLGTRSLYRCICVFEQALGHDGSVLAEFFSAFYGTRRSWSQWKRQRKNERGQYTAIKTEQAWSIKNISYGQKENFLLRDQRRKSWAGKIGGFSPFGEPTLTSCYPLADSAIYIKDVRYPTRWVDPKWLLLFHIHTTRGSRIVFSCCKKHQLKC